MIEITKEQLWYIVTVYPEPVTSKEAFVVYNDSETQDSWWQSAANIINQVMNNDEA